MRLGLWGRLMNARFLHGHPSFIGASLDGNEVVLDSEEIKLGGRPLRVGDKVESKVAQESVLFRIRLSTTNTA